MKHVNELIKNTIDPKRLYTSVKEVSSYHRIQASTDFREAANYCKRSLDRMGIEARILSYEADPEVWYLQNKMFLEWDLSDAWLKLEEPDLLLCDALAEPISIIQRSYPYDFTQGVDLVYLEHGNHPEKYTDIDLQGKIIFVREPFNGYVDWAIKEKGALGIITDYINVMPGIRTREELYDSLNYTSFWWKHIDSEPKTFGFVLSPKKGDMLAKLCLAQKEAYEKQEKDSPYLRVSGKVDTSLYPGKIEVVEAVLPGESDEEVLICAHLCHPKCSCNDNASGVAAAMEVLRSLKYLIDSGKLPKNKRSIKVVLVPEFTGTYAYLSEHSEYKKCVGAINLDMVGGKQTRAYGPITLTSLPYSTPSFINDLTALCMDYASQEAPNLDGDLVAKTNHTIELFSGGSDHSVFSDPTISIPCCMIGQWPDLNYHTATDTLDVIDPEVLAYSCGLAALFAYTLSNLTLENIKEVQNRAHVSLAERLSSVVKSVGKVSKQDIAYLIDHIEKFYSMCVEDIKRVVEVSDEFIAKELKWVKDSCDQMREYLEVSSMPVEIKDARVFVRDYVGPVHTIADSVALHPSAKPVHEEYLKVTKSANVGFKVMGIETMVQFYLDGKRSVSEIVAMVKCDAMMDCEDIVVKYIELLEAVELVHIQ
ncbi:MAG: DUF4910 domain-containing protein [Erysipelotrichaceae bacterium]|nr:DUF4910 domain-containing protein [Erysipelotrichaceae bacterium]